MTTRYLLLCTLLAATITAVYAAWSLDPNGLVLLAIAFLALTVHIVASALRIRHMTMYLLMSILPIAVVSRLLCATIPDIRPHVETFFVLPLGAVLFWLTVFYWAIDLCLKATLNTENTFANKSLK